MKYGYTTRATDWAPNSWRIKTLYAVFFFFPRANPDHEVLYPQVRKWAVEIDEVGDARREVGLDRDGQPIFCAPDCRNYGLWTDEVGAFTDADLEPMQAEEFQRLWRIARAKSKRAPIIPE